MMKISHPFHMVSPSPWPIVASLVLLSSASAVIETLHSNSLSKTSMLMIISLIATTAGLWWRDVKRESSLQGHHTNDTTSLLKYSMIMFILSEVMFFLSFFWAYFHSSITPNIELGMIWPPVGMSIFNPMEMPLLNSIILLSSGATITWAHHAFLSKSINMSLMSLIITIMLGILFTLCQGMEYLQASFSFTDSIYGSTFFLATGFHGIHVIIGSIFLAITAKSISTLQNSKNHFVSFDLSAWYWHFVDVVWLFLFVSIYWWGS